MSKFTHIFLLFSMWLCMGASSFAQGITFNCTKSSWATLGNQEGESIGTVTLNGYSIFDHFEAEIRCAEDPDIYITFANCNTNGGELICYTWEGGKHDLYKGYHYTITIKAFDLPYYELPPVVTETYDFVGSGKTPIQYSSVTVTNVKLPRTDMIAYGYIPQGSSFDVEFSEPVSRAEAVWEQIRTGVTALPVTQKSSDGKVWTVSTSLIYLETNEIANLMITAWDKNGLQMHGIENHSYPVNLVKGVPTGISDNIADGSNMGNNMFNIAGQRINSKPQNGIYIVNGKKYSVNN